MRVRVRVADELELEGEGEGKGGAATGGVGTAGSTWGITYDPRLKLQRRAEHQIEGPAIGTHRRPQILIRVPVEPAHLEMS